MKALAYISLFVCALNIVISLGVIELTIFWGVAAVVPLTMIFYWKLKEKYENKI